MGRRVMAKIEFVGVRKQFTRNRASKVTLTDLLVPSAGVVKTLDGVRAASLVRGNATGTFTMHIDLTVPEGKTLVVLGPSGCGKTTLLRIAAGLEAPDEGTVLYDGRDMEQVAPGERGIGMVFQDYALFPNFTAEKNILSYFMFRRKTPELSREAQRRFERTSELMGVDIEHLLHRMPGGLSGGEKQRVALGRCITRDPALFLLDEPFANLDAQLRERYRVNLRRLLHEFGVTTLYVTHDQQEALVLADSIAVMDRGSIVQVGTYQELYLEPVDLFIASFFNPDPVTPSINVLEGTVVSPAFVGKLVGVRPEDATIASGGHGIDAIVRDIWRIPAQPGMVATAAIGEDEFHARLPQADSPTIGDEVRLRFERLHLFDPDSGVRLATVP